MNAYGTKVSKSKLGSPRFPKRDKPLKLSYAETKMNKKQLQEYLETGKLPKEVEEELNKPKGKRGRPPKMKPEQAQELEKQVDTVNLDEEFEKLKAQLERACKNNVHLQNLLDDLQDKYNKLALDYDKAQKLQYELTRAEDQRDSLRRSLDEVEEILGEEVTKREVLERVVRLYV